MKLYSILFLLLFLGAQSYTQAQSPSINSFFVKYRTKPDAIALRVPGWLVKMGTSFVEAEAEEIRMFRPLLKGLNNVRVLVMEGQASARSNKDLKRMVKLARQDKFQDLISVRDGETVVSVLVREKTFKVRKNKKQRPPIIRNLLVAVQDGEDLVLVTINGRWKKNLIQSLFENEEINIVEEFALLD